MGIEALERRFNQFVEQVRKNAVAAQKEAAEEMSRESEQSARVKLSPDAKEMVQELFDTSVANWYGAWHGKYHRTNSLKSVLRFDDNADGSVSWGYYDDALWHPSIFEARDENKNSLGAPYAFYNIYGMAFERGSHGNKLPGYMPVVTESPLSMIRAGKSGIEKSLSGRATELVQQYFDQHFEDRFYQKFHF